MCLKEVLVATQYCRGNSILLLHCSLQSIKSVVLVLCNCPCCWMIQEISLLHWYPYWTGQYNQLWMSIFFSRGLGFPHTMVGGVGYGTTVFPLQLQLQRLLVGQALVRSWSPSMARARCHGVFLEGWWQRCQRAKYFLVVGLLMATRMFTRLVQSKKSILTRPRLSRFVMLTLGGRRFSW